MAFIPRVFSHPGPRAVARICAVSGSSSGAHRLQIGQGTDVFEFLGRWVELRKLKTAAFQFLHGSLESLEVMTGKPDFDRGRVATFHGPHIVSCPARVLVCHGIVGVAGRERRIHAHGVFTDADGRTRGCHLMSGRCIAGCRGLVLAAYAIDNAYFRALPDPETGFDLLFPVRDGDSSSGADA